MRLTIRHRYNFASGDRVRDLRDPHDWDAVRGTVAGFGLPETREQWERDVGAYDLANRSRAIVDVLRRQQAGRVCSYGVGVAYLEKRIADRAPDLALTCTDFAPRTVARLGQLFPEARVILHDLRVDEPLDADLHLFHRLDAEFTDDEWPEIFSRFHEPVLVVASETIGLRNLARELATQLRHPRATRAGWIRTEDALRALWSTTHDDRFVDTHDLRGYLLTRRRSGDARPTGERPVTA
jgi:hypothetical protein